MCAAKIKASAVSDEELAKALLGTPKAKLVGKSGASSKSKDKVQQSTQVTRKTGLIDIKDPGYSKEELARYVSNHKDDRQDTTFRIPHRDKLYIIPEFMLHDTKDPNLLGISGRAMVKLMYFAANGMPDDYLARAFSSANSTKDQNDDYVSFRMPKLFAEDFAGDALKKKISNAAGLVKGINNSDLYRVIINLIAVLADDEILEDVLREANELQSSFGMNLASD